MTDPDKRNITDQRYHRDAVLRHVEATEPGALMPSGWRTSKSSLMACSSSQHRKYRAPSGARCR